MTDVRAIVFDVDGTLADTEDGHRQAYNRSFEEAGLGWHWDVPLYARLLEVTGGKERMRYFLRDFHPGGPPPDADALIQSLYARKTGIYTAMVRGGAIPLRPGIAALIARAHAAGLKLAVATTTARENVEALFDANLGDGWRERFAVLGCGDQVPNKKPAPDIYTLALARLGVDAAHAVGIEDSGNGIRSLHAAGLGIVAAPSPDYPVRPEVLALADARIAHLDELDAALVERVAAQRAARQEP